MSQLNQIELQNLRHLIGAQDTTHKKLQAYSQQVTDPQVKAFFEKSAQDTEKTKQKLITFLS